MKNEKVKKEKIKKEKNKKEKIKNENKDERNIFQKLGYKIKNYCLKDTTRTVILVLIIIALYFLVNWGVRKIDLAQIDLTKDKLYTLTDTSKNVLKNLSHDTDVYVWGYTEDSSLIDLLKQYHSQNDKINYTVVTKDENPDLVEEYYLEEDYPVIIVKSDLKTNYVYQEDTYTYDASYNYVDITEQKLTNSILDVNTEEKTKVYFLEGKSNYSINGGVSYLSTALQDELYEVSSVNLLSTGAVPEDCDILAVMSLSSDLTESEANAIMEYINKGGNLLIAKDIRVTDFIDFTNFQKVLDLYGVSMPNKYVAETNDNTVAGSYGYVQSDVASDNEITRLIYNANAAPLLYYPGVIEIAGSEELATLKVTSNKLLYSSDEAVAINVENKEEENGQFTTGVSLEKIVSDGVTSKMVIFSTAVSFSDAMDTDIGLNMPMVQYPANYNTILNSFAYLGSKGELYSIRKSSSVTQYMPTETQDRTVRIIITVIPIIIIGSGFIVWFNRRKKA